VAASFCLGCLYDCFGPLLSFINLISYRYVVISLVPKLGAHSHRSLPIFTTSHYSFILFFMPYAYILTNAKKTVLYTGSTGDLKRRLNEHASGHGGHITHKYHLKFLVYFEFLETIQEAQKGERQIKTGSRASKVRLIALLNPNWRPLIPPETLPINRSGTTA